MLARVKLFGPMSLATGLEELSVSLPDDPPTCAALRDRIAGSEPRLVPMLPGCRFAVNGRFATEGQQISEGDEIALIGFVSGG